MNLACRCGMSPCVCGGTPPRGCVNTPPTGPTKVEDCLGCKVTVPGFPSKGFGLEGIVKEAWIDRSGDAPVAMVRVDFPGEVGASCSVAQWRGPASECIQVQDANGPVVLGVDLSTTPDLGFDAVAIHGPDRTFLRWVSRANFDAQVQELAKEMGDVLGIAPGEVVGFDDPRITPPKTPDDIDAADWVKGFFEAEKIDAQNREGLADWFANTLNALEDEEARIKAQTDVRLRQVTARRKGLVARFQPQIEAWVATQLKGKKRSIDLPRGRLGFRKEAEKVVYTDPAAVKAFQDVARDKLVPTIGAAALFYTEVTPDPVTVPQIDRGRLKEAVQAFARTEEAGGAFPDGITIEGGGDRFFVKPPAKKPTPGTASVPTEQET